MDVFISWSGTQSKAFAEALRGWLPKIINAVKPWLSSADIDKGARWSVDVATNLEASKFGIICLTPSNMHADWILFEAGALSKTITNTHVCPVLIGMEPSDVRGPLAQFQATRANRDEIKKLLTAINAALGGQALAESHLDEAFNVWWPKLNDVLTTLPPDDGALKPHRPDRDILEEILALVRSQAREPGARIIDRLYTPAQALRRVDRAINLVRADGEYKDRIKNWEAVIAGDHINLKIETDRSETLAIRFPSSFESGDSLRDTIIERLRGNGGTLDNARRASNEIPSEGGRAKKSAARSAGRRKT